MSDLFKIRTASGQPASAHPDRFAADLCVVFAGLSCHQIDARVARLDTRQGRAEKALFLILHASQNPVAFGLSVVFATRLPANWVRAIFRHCLVSAVWSCKVHRVSLP